MDITDKKPTLSSGMDPFLEIDEFMGTVFFTETYSSYDVNTQKVVKHILTLQNASVSTTTACVSPF